MCQPCQTKKAGFSITRSNKQFPICKYVIYFSGLNGLNYLNLNFSERRMCSCIASIFYKIKDSKNLLLNINTVVLHYFTLRTCTYITCTVYISSTLQSQICHNMESVVILKMVFIKIFSMQAKHEKSDEQNLNQKQLYTNKNTSLIYKLSALVASL